jgi:hypothetical protein
MMRIVRFSYSATFDEPQRLFAPSPHEDAPGHVFLTLRAWDPAKAEPVDIANISVPKRFTVAQLKDYIYDKVLNITHLPLR